MKNKPNFFSNERVVKRLIDEYVQGIPIYVAFDFDDTILAYADEVDETEYVVNLVKRAQNLNLPLLLFTCREGEYLEFALEHLNKLGIVPNHVNTDPTVFKSRKPFFNILLDDRAGLKQSCECLEEFLNYLDNNK